MTMFSFGSGTLYTLPVAAVNNNAVPSGIGGGAGGAQNFATTAWQNYIRLGQVQAFSADINLPIKELRGFGVFPIAVARGKGKVTLKLDNARVNASALNVLLFGDDTNSATAPGDLIVEGEAGTVPTTPYQVTVANSATFVRDLGVYVQGQGGRFSVGATATASGVYAVAAGVYTFNAADVGTKVFIDYEYGPAAVAPYKIIINQQLMGATPTFMLIGYGAYQGKQLYIQLNTCLITKASLNLKIDDFLIPSLDGEAIADPTSGVVGIVATAEL